MEKLVLLSIERDLFRVTSHDHGIKVVSHRQKFCIGQVVVLEKSSCPGIAQNAFVGEIDELALVNVKVPDLHVGQRTIELVRLESTFIDLEQPLVREHQDSTIAVGAPPSSTGLREPQFQPGFSRCSPG